MSLYFSHMATVRTLAKLEATLRPRGHDGSILGPDERGHPEGHHQRGGVAPPLPSFAGH